MPSQSIPVIIAWREDISRRPNPLLCLVLCQFFMERQLYSSQSQLANVHEIAFIWLLPENWSLEVAHLQVHDGLVMVLDAVQRSSFGSAVARTGASVGG